MKRVVTAVGLLALVALVGFGIIHFGTVKPEPQPGAVGSGDRSRSNGTRGTEGQETTPTSLQMLLTQPLPQDAEALTQAFRAFHPSMQQATCAIEIGDGDKFDWKASIIWGAHRIFCVGENAKLPPQLVEGTLQTLFLSEEQIAQVEAHESYILLFYGGDETRTLEQYVALAAASAIFSKFGAVATLNLTARSAFPSTILFGEGAEEDIIQLLRTLPLPALYCGFEVLRPEPDGQVWLRTHGAERFGCPNLAVLAGGLEEQEAYFDVFGGILEHCIQSRTELAPGDTLQLGGDVALSIRAPTEVEVERVGQGRVLICELVELDEPVSAP